MPIEKSAFVPKQANLYYALRDQIPDFLYLSAIFNPSNNRWLEGKSHKLLTTERLNYGSTGNPLCFSVIDLRRTLIWPFPATATGILYVVYKAKAPTISNDHVPILPYSVGSQLLEYSTIADLMEQAREFKKAQLWIDRMTLPAPGKQLSLIDLARLEIKALNRMDREMVLEPYSWLFHGGAFSGGDDLWVSNEVPTGAKNGVNATFTLIRTPSPTASLLLMLNGQTLFQGEGYSLSGNTITMETGYVPDSDDSLRAWYQVT